MLDGRLLLFEEDEEGFDVEDDEDGLLTAKIGGFDDEDEDDMFIDADEEGIR